jgi:hypothetical protein
MSEMPLKYLEMRNGRIFYTLKSFNIKALNNIYRESVHKWRTAESSGEKAAALKNTGKLVLLLVMAGATADELKDFLLGKQRTSFSDNMHENLIKLTMMSRYSLDQGWSKGFFETFMKDILLPPTGFVDDPFKDIYKTFKGEPDLKTVQNLPWGKVAYSWLSPVAEDKNYSVLKKRLTDRFVSKGTMDSSIRKDMNEYNKWAYRNKEKPIRYEDLKKAQRRANSSN